MYHYVREQEGWKGIVPLSPKEFSQQIDDLNKTYDIISVDQIHEKRSKPWCVLTFDDGTKDQYTHAFDILKSKGVPAYFTIMSGPLVTGKIPMIHLVHTVLSFISDEEIWEMINDKFDTSGVEEASLIYFYEQNKLRRYNKYMLNVKLSEAEATDILGAAFHSLFPDRLHFIDNFYISENEIQRMSREGMTIGVHCHDHLQYNGNPQHFYDQEIEPCRKFLKRVLGFEPVWYTPAFGGGVQHEEMQEQLTPILLHNGFKGAFTTKSRGIPLEPEFWMDRIDGAKILDWLGTR